MAIASKYDQCQHCGEEIALRTYAAPRAMEPDARRYGVKLWTAGNGQFPGDQRFCEAHIIDADGSIGDHEPRGQQTDTYNEEK